MRSTRRFEVLIIALLFAVTMSAHGDDLRLAVDSEGWSLRIDL